LPPKKKTFSITLTSTPQLDYRKIATMYGNGATYDSIEGRFRIIKKEAAQLKSEIDSGARPEAPIRGATASGTSTPKKARTSPKKTDKQDKTIAGRVNKSANGTPTKKGAGGNAVKGIKEEVESSASSFFDGTGDGGGDLMGEGMMSMEFDLGGVEDEGV
jgi:hypothetical protein